MPTLPLAAISMLLVGAPGRMRKGRRDAAGDIAHKEIRFVAGDVPGLGGEAAAAVCSSRCAGVLLVVMCRSNTGVDVRKPTLPVLSTKSELVGASAGDRERNLRRR